MKKFQAEPVKEPANLRARAGVFRQQPVSAKSYAPRLVVILSDWTRARENQSGFFNKNRGLPRRIEQQKFSPALKGLFLDELRLDLIFAKEQTGKARMRAKRIVVKCDHLASCSRAPEN